MTLLSHDQNISATSRLALFIVFISLEAFACDVLRIDNTAYFNMLPTAFRIAFMALENASLRNYVSLNLNTLWHACL